jgi:hypothetical protein
MHTAHTLRSMRTFIYAALYIVIGLLATSSMKNVNNWQQYQCAATTAGCVDSACRY